METTNVLEYALRYAKDYGIKFTEEEAISGVVHQINQATENLQPPPFDAPIIGFERWLFASPRFRAAIHQYKREAIPLLEKYGSSEGYAVLYLHSEASVRGIIAVCSQLEAKLELDFENQLYFLLLANDQVLARNQTHLEARGFEFFPHWRDEKSVYRRLLKAGETNGKRYEMVRRGSDWVYAEKPIHAIIPLVP